MARTVDVWPRVIEWKKRYVAEGLDGLEDRPKPGRRPVIDEVAVLCDDEMDNYATRKHPAVRAWPEIDPDPAIELAGPLF